METMSVEKLLDQLAEERRAYQALAKAYEDKIEASLPPKAKARIQALKEERDKELAEQNKKAAELEGAIRENTLQIGSTVRGEELMAVYNRGRVTWDSEGLDQYAVDHPEVKYFRKEGQPSITIRSR